MIREGRHPVDAAVRHVGSRACDDVFAWWVGPGIGCQGSRVLLVETLNGSVAYSGSGSDRTANPWALQVLEIAGGKIVEFTFFLSTERLFPLFGLPPRLESRARARR